MQRCLGSAAGQAHTVFLIVQHLATLGVLEAQREAGSGGLWPAMGLHTRLLRSLLHSVLSWPELVLLSPTPSAF